MVSSPVASVTETLSTSPSVVAEDVELVLVIRIREVADAAVKLKLTNLVVSSATVCVSVAMTLPELSRISMRKVWSPTPVSFSISSSET